MQKYACIILLIGFYFIGLPLSYIFMFVIHLDIYGFWLGMISAETVTNLLLFILIWHFDWNIISGKTQKRIHALMESKLPRNSTLSLNGEEEEHIELLQIEFRENIIHSQTDDDQTAERLSINDGDMSQGDTSSSESLFRLVGGKIIILILLCSIFIVSFITSI